MEVPAGITTVYLCDATTISRPVMAYMVRRPDDRQGWDVYECGEPAEVLQTSGDGTSRFTTDEALDRAFSLVWPDVAEVSLVCLRPTPGE